MGVEFAEFKVFGDSEKGEWKLFMAMLCQLFVV